MITYPKRRAPELMPDHVWRMRRQGKPRDLERSPAVDGVLGSMIDDDGFVRPEFREHVAAMRERRPMSPIGDVMLIANARAAGDD